MRRQPYHQQTARRIAYALGEKAKLPQHQIKRIVQVCGSEQALGWLREVQIIESQGGMLTRDGNQRRTPGGAYFRLVRERLIQSGQQEKMQIIFRGKKPPSARQARPRNRNQRADTSRGRAGSSHIRQRDYYRK